MAKEQTPSRSPRRIPLIVAAVLVVLTVGAVALLVRDDTIPKGAGAGTNASDDDVASPAVPTFRFTESTRTLVRTSPKTIRPRQRRASNAAAGVAERVLGELYTEGFLDPANWERGDYDDAFRGFARGARERAISRPDPLTAGPRAGERFDSIEARSGRIATRILVDRRGAPLLLVSIVRFSAVASGDDVETFRSVGQFFFERVGGTWKIVSFDVTRNDRAGEAP